MLGLNEIAATRELRSLHIRSSSGFAERLHGRFHTSGVSGSMSKHRQLLSERREEIMKQQASAGSAALISLTRREEEFRRDAERLLALQSRLEAIQREKALKDRRREERLWRRRQFIAACRLQRWARAVLTRMRRRSADIMLEFLRTAYNVRAVNVGVWAARTMAAFSTLAKRSYLEYKQRVRVQEQQEQQRRRLELERAQLLEEIAAAAASELDRNSFFLTQQRTHEDEEEELDLLYEYDNAARGTFASSPYKGVLAMPSSPSQQSHRSPMKGELNTPIVEANQIEASQELASELATALLVTSAGVNTISTRKFSVKLPVVRRASALSEQSQLDSALKIKETIQRISDEQRDRARRTAAKRQQREQAQKLLAELGRGEEVSRRRELRLMFAEDRRLHRLLQKKRDAVLLKTPPATGAVMSALSSGPQNTSNNDKDARREHCENNSTAGKEDTDQSAKKKTAVYRQPRHISETLKELEAREMELHRQEAELSRLERESRRAEAVQRERRALQQRLHAKAALRREEEQRAAEERLRAQREREKVAKLVAQQKERLLERQTIRQLSREGKSLQHSTTGDFSSSHHSDRYGSGSDNSDSSVEEHGDRQEQSIDCDDDVLLQSLSEGPTASSSGVVVGTMPRTTAAHNIDYYNEQATSKSNGGMAGVGKVSNSPVQSVETKPTLSIDTNTTDTTTTDTKSTVATSTMQRRHSLKTNRSSSGAQRVGGKDYINHPYASKLVKKKMPTVRAARARNNNTTAAAAATVDILEPLPEQSSMESSFSSLMTLISKAKTTLDRGERRLNLPPFTTTSATINQQHQVSTSIEATVLPSIDEFLGSWTKLNPPPSIRHFSSASSLLAANNKSVLVSVMNTSESDLVRGADHEEHENNVHTKKLPVNTTRGISHGDNMKTTSQDVHRFENDKDIDNNAAAAAEDEEEDDDDDEQSLLEAALNAECNSLLEKLHRKMLLTSEDSIPHNTPQQGDDTTQSSPSSIFNLDHTHSDEVHTSTISGDVSNIYNHQSAAESYARSKSAG